ncbi:MAG TPA: endonuclease/exonuclease/phosphatase family protein [Vicinamibacterales bacterium]
MRLFLSRFTRILGFIAIASAAACAERPKMAIEAAPSSCRQVTASTGATVTWIGPTDRRDVRALDRWCAAVGPVEVAGPATGEGHPVDVLAIVSWNVHVGGGDLPSLISRLRRGEFTGGVPVADFAILLQEAYRAGDVVPARIEADAAAPRRILERPAGGERHDVAQIARAAGLAYVYVPSMRNGRAGGPEAEDRGNAILSTMPLEQIVAIELPFERQRRVAIASTIRGRTSSGVEWSLTLADAHFDTAFAIARGGPIAARRRQADALIEALGVAGGSSILVAGDFNTWLGDGEAAIRHLRRAFPDATQSRHQPTWSVGVVGATMDFVFARADGREVNVRRLSERLGSDHYPLLADIRF